MPVSNVRILCDVVERRPPRAVQRARWRLRRLAFLLAAIGIHGLLSFAVSSRAQEIGVRLALGAQRRDIFRMILGDAARLCTAGILLGAAAAWLAASSMRALLAGVTPPISPRSPPRSPLPPDGSYGQPLPGPPRHPDDPASAIRVE